MQRAAGNGKAGCSSGHERTKCPVFALVMLGIHTIIKDRILQTYRIAQLNKYYNREAKTSLSLTLDGNRSTPLWYPLVLVAVLFNALCLDKIDELDCVICL